MREKEIKTEVILQYRGCETEMETIKERIKKNIQSKNIGGEITSLEIYVKPEDFTVYYVVNDTIDGRVPLF